MKNNELIRLIARLFGVNSVDDSDESRDARVKRLRTALILFFVFVVVYYVAPRKQSFLISADTEILTVVTDGNATASWHVDRLTLCIKREKPEIPAFGNLQEMAAKGDTEPCDGRIFREVTIDDADIVWPMAVELAIRMGGPDTIEVHAKRFTQSEGAEQPVGGAKEKATPDSATLLTIDGHEITDNSVLKFDKGSLSAKSILMLSGNVAVGDKVRPESRHLLRQGRYEIREHLPFRDRATLVHKGDLVVGDWIQVVSEGEHLPVKGRAFITAANKNVRGFSVVLTTPAAWSELQIARGGQVTEFSASWTERLTSDLLPVALSTLLGLFGACLAILHSFRRKDSA